MLTSLPNSPNSRNCRLVQRNFVGVTRMDTSISLLERLRLRPDEAGWQRLVSLYTPLIRTWLRRHALRNQDIEDLVQEVLALVVRKMPDFKRGPRAGSFRSWLRHITANCLRDFWRAQRFQPQAIGEGSFAQFL